MGQDSSVDIVIRLQDGDRVRFPSGVEIILLTAISRALRPNRPTNQWVAGGKATET
jgi:hypothetical protein